VKYALISTAVLAAVATVFDWVWATFLPQHLMAGGLVHGAALCLAMGAMLAMPSRRAGVGAASGIVVGVSAAALFYALAPMLRMAAMLPAWIALWVMLAAASRWLGALSVSWREAAVRGVIAGVASGAAFYAVSGMWTRWNPAAINYADHLVRWAFAFAPGFIALQAGVKAQRGPH
jgi:hypothetical protein